MQKVCPSFLGILVILTLSLIFVAIGGPNFQGQHATTVQAQDKALVKVSEKLGKLNKDAVIVADSDGQLIRESSTGKLKSDGYTSVVDFASAKGKTDKCKKISSKCLKCPDGKIYCTNATSFLGM